MRFFLVGCRRTTCARQNALYERFRRFWSFALRAWPRLRKLVTSPSNKAIEQLDVRQIIETFIGQIFLKPSTDLVAGLKCDGTFAVCATFAKADSVRFAG